MRTCTTLGVLSTIALAAGCTPRSVPLSGEDAAAVRASFDSTVSRIRAGNFAGWAAEFSDDARFYAPNARAVIGRTAILAWGRALPAIEQFAFSDVQVAGAGDLAWGTSAYTLKFKDMPIDSGKQLVVFRRKAGGAWEVIAVSFNSNLPLQQPAAPARR
jgi:ketosteroid isomerase-like protein